MYESQDEWTICSSGYFSGLKDLNMPQPITFPKWNNCVTATVHFSQYIMQILEYVEWHKNKTNKANNFYGMLK